MKIDLEESSFNDLSIIPADVFDIEITNDMRINDYRSGKFFTYKKDMTPVQTKIRDKLPEPLLQTAPENVGKQVVQWIAMAIGMGLIILGVARWCLRKRCSTADC